MCQHLSIRATPLEIRKALKHLPSQAPLLHCHKSRGQKQKRTAKEVFMNTLLKRTFFVAIGSAVLSLSIESFASPAENDPALDSSTRHEEVTVSRTSGGSTLISVTSAQNSKEKIDHCIDRLQSLSGLNRIQMAEACFDFHLPHLTANQASALIERADARRIISHINASALAKISMYKKYLNHYRGRLSARDFIEIHSGIFSSLPGKSDASINFRKNRWLKVAQFALDEFERLSESDLRQLKAYVDVGLRSARSWVQKHKESDSVISPWIESQKEIVAAGEDAMKKIDDLIQTKLLQCFKEECLK